jgi:hypothetical protein
MAANNETRIVKSNTLEELRQKTNEVSLHLGDNGLIDSRILDKTETFTASAGQTLFTSNTLRFEIKPEESFDDSANSESLSVGVVKVYKDGTELTQGLDAANFEVPNFVLAVTLQNSPTIPAEFVEGAVLTQSNGFSGTLLSADSSLLRFKAITGIFSTSANLGIPHTDANKRVNSSDIASSTAQSATYGNIIKLNTAASAGDVIKVVSTNVIDAVNEVQDDIGDITALGTSSTTDLVTAINELETGIRGTSSNLVATDLTTTANDLVAGINELDAEIGNVDDIDAASGYSATSVVTGITELQSHLGTKGNLLTSTDTDLVVAINEVHNDALASLKKIDSGTQTLNTDLLFTSGNTVTFPDNTTLDIRNGSLLVGAGGTELQFDTAFIALTANDASNSAVNQLGLEVKRAGSDFARLQWNETLVGSTPSKAWELIGMNDAGAANTAGIVTFYNAKDLIAGSETGISVVWDDTNDRFNFALTADPTIQLGNDLSGSVTLTNLATQTYTLTATINAGTVENSMLASNAVTNAKILDSTIANAKLSNPSWTITDGSNATPVNLGDTLTIQGTSGEVEVVENSNTVTVGLPTNVDVDGNLVVGGNLTVQGTQTILNTTTLEVEDTLVLAGNNLSSEPSSGGFGLEVGPITSPSGVASGVTGAHSIVYNYGHNNGDGTYGRWEADGSLILSTATLSTPQVEGSDFGPGDNLTFSAGSGLSESVSGFAVTYTNTDRGSSQNIFKNVASSSGTAVADNNNDTLTILGGNDLSTSVSGDTLTIQHDNSGATAGSYGARHTVPNITVDARGHVTNISNNSAITLGSLGYSGSTSADNYGSFNIRANTAASTAIGSGETITFTDSGATTVTRSGNTIDISSVNTQYSVGDGGLTAVNFTTTRRDKLDGIAASANNYSWQYDTSGNGSNQTVSNGNVIRIQGSGATSVTHSGSTITISSTDNNDNDNTITNIGVNNANYTNGNINFQASGAASISKSGNTVTISSVNTTYGVGDGGLTQKNFTTTLKNKLDGIAAGATNVTSNSQISNGEGYTTYSANQTLNNNSNVHFEGLMVGQTSGSTANTIRCVGDVVAFYSSDERLKDNITPIENSLEKVGQLKGYEFDWNDKQEVYEGHDVGVIAQEVEKVVPEIVTTREHDGYKAVKYEKLVPLLINAINELKAEIEELKVINKGIEK